MAGLGSSGQQGGVQWSPRLGAHLEASRTQAGLRRIDLAQRLGVSEESIRLWERGAVQPSEEHLVRLIPMLSIESSFWQSQEVAAAVADEEPELARRLREERAERSLTQAALAAQLGVPQATYAGWETGRTTPSADHYALLASLLDVAEERIAALCSAPLQVDHSEWPAFGQLVGARRQALRLTRNDLAEALGVSPRAVMSWELGYRRPRPAQLTALAAVLAVPAAELARALPQRSAPSRLGALDPVPPARARPPVHRRGPPRRHHRADGEPLDQRTQPPRDQEPPAPRRGAADPRSRLAAVVSPHGLSERITMSTRSSSRTSRPLARRSRRGTGDEGAALVELGIILPILFLVVFGIMEFGWAYFQQLDLRHGAREGARLAAVNYKTTAFPTASDQTTQIVNEVCDRMDSGGSTTVQIDQVAGGAVGAEIQVTVQKPLNQLTGFLDFALGGITLSSTVNSRVEQTATWADMGSAQGCP